MGTIALKLDIETENRIKYLKEKWNVKTGTKILLKCLDLAYENELKGKGIGIEAINVKTDVNESQNQVQ